MRRWWVLLLPLAPVALAMAFGDDIDVALTGLLAPPVLLVVAALGWGAGRGLGHRAAPAGAAVLAVAAVPLAVAAAEQIDRAGAEKLSRAEQRRLPIGESLGSLCPGASSSEGLTDRLRAETENLIAELERRPDALVDYTYHDAHTAEERHEELTVRELAEEQLHDLDTYAETDPEGERCVPDLQRRLREALG